MLLTGRKILLGVCGGIAAYKACELARMLMREGARVQVALTPRAAEFVTPLTFSALTGSPALVSEFPPPGASPEGDVYAHLNLSCGIDCYVIAPATATTLAKLAGGLADNLVTGAYLSNTAPVVIAPAMNCRMWAHPAVQENVARLRRLGHVIVEPGVGELACGDEGAGRLAELREINAAVLKAATSPVTASGELASPDAEQALAGKRIIVTAGGTREYLDPVRFITNASSGRLGLEVSAELIGRGADVELLETGIPVPADLAARLAYRETTKTAFDLLQALTARMPDADGLVMLAAVADYSPSQYLPDKRKKDGSTWSVEFAETTDILATIAGARQPHQLIAGVSLEDTDWLERSQAKARAKNADLMLAVELGGDLPFGENKLFCAIVNQQQVIEQPAPREKSVVAALLADALEGGFNRG